MNSLSLLNCCIPPFWGFAHNFGTLDAVLKEGGFIPLWTGRRPYFNVHTMDIDKEIENYLVKLGKRIARARKAKGLTQDDLWYQANLARRTINKVELGQGNVKIGTLIKISKALGISLDKLIKI